MDMQGFLLLTIIAEIDQKFGNSVVSPLESDDNILPIEPCLFCDMFKIEF